MPTLADKLRDAFGEKSVGGNNFEKLNSWLDTGFPPLNKMLSGSYEGGFPVKRMVEIFGPESSGKTAISTAAMASAQQQGGVAIFMDHERSFMPHLGEKMGLKVDELILEYPDTFEQSVTNAMKMCQQIRDGKMIEPEAPIVVVFDSLASMVPQSKFAKEITEQGMNDSLALAKATSSVFPTMQLHAEKMNICVLMLNQEREKPGVMFGDPTTTPGGKAPKFYSSIRLQIGGGKIMSGSGKDKQMIGKEITCKSVKNKVTRPFLQTSWKFMFNEDGTGSFDVIGSMVDHLAEIGQIEKSGAYLVIDGKKTYRSKLVEKLNDDPDAMNKLKAMLPEEKLPETA